MNATPDHLTPGHTLPLCRGCAHRIVELEIHPTPCRKVYWLPGFSARHVPTLILDASGQRCSDYEPAVPPWQPAAPEPQEATA